MRLRPQLTGLWRNPDFIKLWAGRTVSHFGSLMGALSFVAVLALNATPFQMGLLMALRVAPGPLVGLLAGVWVDRLRRRPILIIADIGRAALIGSIPIAFFLGILRIEQLYVVAFAEGLLTTFFDVAYRSYLPALVPRKDLVEANSKLSGSESVVEVSAFSIGGWIAQLLGAVVVAIVDAFSYLVSGISLALIRKPEPEPAPSGDRQSMGREILEGLVLVRKTPVLLAITIGAASEGLVYGIVGSVILIFGIRELGFEAGVLGTLFAVGGISSFIGALYAGRLTRRFGIGPTMIAGFLIFVLSILLLPLARGPLIIAGLFLVAQQLSDAAITIYSINETSLRQAVTSDRVLGRVNASIRSVGVGALFLGALLGGALAEEIGLRWTLAVGAGTGLLGAIWLALSPVRRIREPPAPFDEPTASQAEAV